MNRSALVALVMLGPPILYGLLLLVRTAARRRAEHGSRSRPQTVSVADLTARLERERAGEGHELRWPRADPDCGILRDDRPTRELAPLPPSRPAPPRVRRYLTANRADSTQPLPPTNQKPHRGHDLPP
jgi:hypothetical protein